MCRIVEPLYRALEINITLLIMHQLEKPHTVLKTVPTYSEYLHNKYSINVIIIVIISGGRQKPTNLCFTVVQ